MAEVVSIDLTERLRSEAEVIDLLRTVLDRVPVGVALLMPVDDGRDFEYVYENPVHESLKPGVPALGRTYGDVWPELAAFALPRFREVLKTGASWSAENTPLEVEIEPGRRESRFYTLELSRIVVDGRSVLLDRSIETTTEVKSQQALRDSERNFRALVTASTDVVYGMSPDWSTMQQLQGQEFLISTERDNPDWLQEYIPGSDQPVVVAATGEAIRTKSVFELEHRVYQADGGVGWTHSRAVPLLDERGEITEWFGFASDITEQKAAEEALRESQERYERVFIAVREGFAHYQAVFDEAGRISDLRVLDINPAGAQLAGKSREEQIGRMWRDLWPGIDPSLFAQYQKAKATGEPLRFEDMDNAFTGRSYEVTILPMPEDEFVVTFFDITERKRAEDERIRLLESERRAACYGEALNQIDADVTSTLDVGSIMNRVLERAALTVQADTGAVWMPVDGEWEARYTWQAPDWLNGSRARGQELPFSMQAASERRALLVPEPASHPDWEASVAQRLNVRQVLDAPLMLGTDESGDLILYKLQGRGYTEDDRDFLQKASTAVSLALQNARRYERERDIADTLQEALLTVPDEMPGIEFAHAYHSAAETARVGGDFYDVFRLSEDLVGVVVGDVAGKGLEASALTSLTKNTIRAHATEKGAVPARIIALTNEVVLQETQGESFVTVFLGVLDLRDGCLLYANAGHTTGAVVALDGTVRALPSTGPVIGAFSGMAFDEAEQHLDLDESLFLYTDGLTEARSGDGLYGEERLFELLAHLKDGRPAETSTRRARGGTPLRGRTPERRPRGARREALEGQRGGPETGEGRGCRQGTWQLATTRHPRTGGGEACLRRR